MRISGTIAEGMLSLQTWTLDQG